MMATDTKRIDDAVLALLYLTLHDQSQASTSFAPEALQRLHESGMIGDPAENWDSIELTPDGLQRSKKLFNSMFAASSAEAVASGSVKYPAITVDLADLGGEMWPILRRVSYAMSDADIDEAEVERYKSEVKEGSDPVAVSRRWVNVQR
jgi:uncharacterized protein DUF6429